uniref:F-box/kelch-repeat protein n=1 Tax=Davidia involucrata TaxID=16924 RepID=A0A5B6YWK2_DAVIN
MAYLYFYGYANHEMLWYGVNVCEEDLFKAADEVLMKETAARLQTNSTNTEEENSESKRSSQLEVLYALERPIGELGLRIRPSAISDGVISFQSSCVALGPFIYCVGGLDVDHEPPILDQVHRLDTRRRSHPESESGWESCTPMNVARYCSKIAAIDGKLFVMGGTLEHMYGLDPVKWGECFDPITNKWQFLPPIPVEVDQDQISQWPVAVIAEDNKFVVCSNRNLLSFDVKSWSWTREDCRMFVSLLDRMKSDGKSIFRLRPAMAGSTMYWFDAGRMFLSVYAYDLIQKKCFSRRLGLEDFESEGDLFPDFMIPTLPASSSR